MPRRAASRSASSASPREAELAALLAAREGQLQSERARAADLERALAERDSQHCQRLDEQTALADVLRIISQSPADLQSVLDAIVTSAARLWQADEARVRRLEGEWLVPAAGFGDASAERGNLPVPGDRSSIAGRAVTERRTVHCEDTRVQVTADAGYEPSTVALMRHLDFPVALVAPLLRHGDPIGSLALFRRRAFGPFKPEQVRAFEAFADQAVIAIENARLFRELQERLEEQTATGEVLRALSQSPTNLQPVLDAIVEGAARLWQADEARLRRLEGEWLVPVAGFDRATVASGRRPVPAGPTSVVGRALGEGRVLHVTDSRAQVTEADGYGPEEVSLFANSGYPVALVVPLVREGEPIGSLAIMRRRELGPFPARQIQLLQTFADQAVIAIENTRLFGELQARTGELQRSVEQLTALFEVSGVVSATLDLDRVLETVVARAAALAGADGGAIYAYDAASGLFELRATHRMSAELVAAIRGAPIRVGETPVGRAAAARAPVQVADLLAEPEETAARRALERAGYRALLSVPLLREQEIVGALVVRRKTPGAFAPDTVALIQTFANQSALAIQNARLFRELADKSAQLEEASRHKSEFLASMSHELRTPLNAVIGFSEVLREQLFGELNERQRRYVQHILEAGRHLLGLINDILDLSKVEAGRMELDLGTFDLGEVLEAGLVMVRERATRRGIELTLDVPAEVGRIEADERKVRQVVFNLLTNAVKFTLAGGRIEVGARRADGWIEVAVADTGLGIAPEEQARVFETFGQAGSAAGQSEGTGLGLTLCKRFVELHGGTIGVASEAGRGSTFTFTLPVRQPEPPAHQPTGR